ncbi:MAG: bifunctional DNA-formamidopyrimidine glycosylase/DNA-(apurinic or apyrimidinic site) lyase [Alkalispirochaeta sp.]
MPELPEVFTTIEDLKKHGLEGSQITSVDVQWPRTVGGNDEAFAQAVTDRCISRLRRRGKYIVLDLDSGAAVLVHLRMSGRLYVSEPTEPYTGYERVRLGLLRNDGTAAELRFHVPRKFGRMTFAPDPERALSHLGIEPLSPQFHYETLAAILAGRTRRIKPLLLDQRCIAGLGNIYTDEALWEARIHPMSPAGALGRAHVEALAAAIPQTLNRGIRNLGTSLGSGVSNFVFPGKEGQAHNQEDLRVFQRTGSPCRRCGATIERIIVAQRSSHFCPVCQRMNGSPTPPSVQ